MDDQPHVLDLGLPEGLLRPLRDAWLVSVMDRYDVAFANDPDSDRHGIATPS